MYRKSPKCLNIKIIAIMIIKFVKTRFSIKKKLKKDAGQIVNNAGPDWTALISDPLSEIRLHCLLLPTICQLWLPVYNKDIWHEFNLISAYVFN